MTTDDAESHFKLAEVHFRARRFDDAIRECTAALRVDAKHGMSLHLLGILKFEMGDSLGGIEIFQRALKVRPADPACWNAFAVALRGEDRWDEAIDAAKKSIALQPRYLTPYNTLGTSQWNAGHHEEAIATFRKAIAIKPDFADAHLNLSYCLLALGNFSLGWDEFEWRLRASVAPLEPLAQPMWNGSDISGKMILLRAEQGLGDTIQFVRFAKLVAQRGAKVILQCPAELKELMQSAAGVAAVVADMPSNFDEQIPLLSLPRVLKARLGNLDPVVPYLAAPVERIENWRERILKTVRSGKLKVGLAWRGNPQHVNDRRRSIPPDALTPLVNIDVEWFSLQKPSASPGFSVHDFTDLLTDFTETAGFISQLDLVICADTSVAHLAGALGKPTWVMVPSVSDWRWLLDREDSPWYPTMRLFRQKIGGDWSEVIARVAGELRELALTS